MDHATQIEHARRLSRHLAGRTTDMAPSLYENPVDQYTCSRRLAHEREVLFRRWPLNMGLSCQIPKAGDYITDDFSGVPVLVARGEDGRARAFLNVCRHRGAPVAEGRGRGRRRFVCPYHAWVYRTDGRLERIPREAGFADLDRECHGLVELPLAEKYGMLWVRTVPGAPLDVDVPLQGAARDLAAYGFESYHHFETRVLEPRMNWKLVVDTFLETYHIRVLHRNTLDALLETDIATFEGLGRNLRAIYARKNFQTPTEQPEKDWNLLPYTTVVYVLFPNTVLIVQQDHIETWRVYPNGGDPDASRLYVSLYTPEPSDSPSATGHWQRNMDLLMAVVDQEDFPLGERMQRGFHSGAQAHLTFGRNEPALAHYHAALDAELAWSSPG